MEIIADAKMSSPATLGDESSPWQSSVSEEDLVHEESMLKRKLAILEEFMDNGKASICLRTGFIQEHGIIYLDESCAKSRSYGSRKGVP
jgi:hypothetical protein